MYNISNRNKRAAAYSRRCQHHRTRAQRRQRQMAAYTALSTLLLAGVAACIWLGQ